MKLKLFILLCLTGIVILGTNITANACSSSACAPESQAIDEEDIDTGNCCNVKADQTEKKGCDDGCDNECGDECTCNCCDGVSVVTGFVIEDLTKESIQYHAYLSPYSTSYTYEYFGAIWQPPKV